MHLLKFRLLRKTLKTLESPPNPNLLSEQVFITFLGVQISQKKITLLFSIFWYWTPNIFSANHYYRYWFLFADSTEL